MLVPLIANRDRPGTDDHESGDFSQLRITDGTIETSKTNVAKERLECRCVNNNDDEYTRRAQIDDGKVYDDTAVGSDGKNGHSRRTTI